MRIDLVYQPHRDGSLENDIIIHELTHGTSNRMTGGGGANCLQGYDGAGMGEGWSDALAEYVFIFLRVLGSTL